MADPALDNLLHLHERPRLCGKGGAAGSPASGSAGPLCARGASPGAALSRAAAACVAGPSPWHNSKHAAFGSMFSAKLAYAYDTVAQSGGKAPRAVTQRVLRAIHP